MNQKGDSEWKEARRRCRLSSEDVRMAKELGFQPRGLIKNIPSPSQKWKAPVRVWVRDLYEKKFGSHEPAVSPPKPREPEYSWPDSPEIPELVLIEEIGRGDDNPFEFDFAPPLGRGHRSAEHSVASPAVPVPLGRAVNRDCDLRGARSSKSGGVRNGLPAAENGSAAAQPVSPATNRGPA